MRKTLSFGNIFIVSLFAAISIVAFIASELIAKEELSTQDSSALYGGELEKGYPSGGYIVVEQRSGEYNYCSIVKIEDGKGITAAHCVEDVKAISLGFGGFTFDGASDIQVNKVYKSAEWDGDNLARDVAIVEYTDNANQRPSADIEEPQESCRYRVVGYGRTEEDEKEILEKRPRKSAKICIEDIDSNTFRLRGYDGGICLGDSGSPVYEEDSNKVVGIISSVVSFTAADANNPCFIGNQAIAVRADSSIEDFDENNPITGNSAYVTTDVTQANDLYDIFIEFSGLDPSVKRSPLLLFISVVMGGLSILITIIKSLKRNHSYSSSANFSEIHI